MGKKHKKHKYDRKQVDTEEDDVSEPPVEKQQSLKLVLKVGGPETVADIYSHTPEEVERTEKKHKHKKKKKKKDKRRYDERPKQEYEETEVSSIPDDADDEDPSPSKRRALEVETEDEGSLDSRLDETHSTKNMSEDRGVLKQCLEHLQKLLQRKDIHGFFAYPVNDIIAPGYSSIIAHPMDFSTMASKIENDEYRNLMEYKEDFETMCHNAMTYNRPETIYHKEAKRLFHIGTKQMSKDKLINMKRTLSVMAAITADEMGFDEKGNEISAPAELYSEDKKWEDKSKSPKRVVQSKFEAIPDELSPEEILAQAQEAAREAKEQLTLRQVSSKFGFLRQKSDGTTSLTVLNPEDEGIVSKTEKVVNLGSLVGKLQTGTGTLSSFKEDKRNKVTPVNYLNYGPFSSYAPQYDSSFSNITKDESDLLLSTYGDETAVEYAHSVMSFVDGAGDYAIKMVDNLLDTLTKKEHSKTQKLLELNRKDRERKLESERFESHQPVTPSGIESTETKPLECTLNGTEMDSTIKDYDLNSSRNYNELGVDMSFLDTFGKDKQNSEDTQTQQKLNQSADLIKELEQAQNQRLGQRLPAHLAHVPGPSGKEMNLAEKVTNELKDLTKAVTPADVVSVKGVRNAMGITIEPISPDPSPAADQEAMDDSHMMISQTENLVTVASVNGNLANCERSAFLETAPSADISMNASMQNS